MVLKEIAATWCPESPKQGSAEKIWISDNFNQKIQIGFLTKYSREFLTKYFVCQKIIFPANSTQYTNNHPKTSYCPILILHFPL